MGTKEAVRERNREAAAPVEVGGCQHHWLIETPRGALSSGRCKRCGEEREFRNSANDYIWDDDSTSGSGYKSWRGVASSPKVASGDDDMTASSGSGGGAAALSV